MIPSRELRIGNWISFGDAINQICCTHFDIANLVKMEILKEESAAYQPIQLTHKWLIALGFKNASTGELGWYRIKTHDFEIDEIKINDVSFFLSCADIKIKYVHQLQNLFFAITGQELEREFLTEKCKKCGGCTSEKKHTCPYLSDMHNDKTTLCNCCDNCETECGREI